MIKIFMAQMESARGYKMLIKPNLNSTNLTLYLSMTIGLMSTQKSRKGILSNNLEGKNLKYRNLSSYQKE